MVAPKATIDLVVSEGTLTAAGTDLSSFYIIDNNLDPVMSLSFGACEAALARQESVLQRPLGAGSSTGYIRVCVRR